MEPKWNQNDAKRRQSCSKTKPWSVRTYIFVFALSFFCYNCKNDHGALVDFTQVKGTNVENLFLLKRAARISPGLQKESGIGSKIEHKL